MGLAVLALSCTVLEEVEVAWPQLLLIPTKFGGRVLPAVTHHRYCPLSDGRPPVAA
jgi:hypothetical protein